MPLIGELALALALIVAFYSIVANVVAVQRDIPSLFKSGCHALWAMIAMVSVAVLVLWISLLQGDCSLEYVTNYTSLTLPAIYKITALWGGQQGSLLFWTWLLSIFTAIVAFQHRRNRVLAPIRPVGARGVSDFLPFHAEFRDAAVRDGRQGSGGRSRPQSVAAELLDGDPSAFSIHRLCQRECSIRVRRCRLNHRAFG